MKARKVHEAFTLKGPSEDQIEDAWHKMEPNQMLAAASDIGDLKRVKLAVEQGADTNDGNYSALQIAAKNGHLDIVKYLVEQGADIRFKNWALWIAADTGHLDVVKYLVEQGADIHTENNRALRWAKMKDHLDVVKYLKSKLDVKESFYPALDEAFTLKGPSEEDIRDIINRKTVYDITIKNVRDFLNYFLHEENTQMFFVNNELKTDEWAEDSMFYDKFMKVGTPEKRENFAKELGIDTKGKDLLEVHSLFAYKQLIESGLIDYEGGHYDPSLEYNVVLFKPKNVLLFSLYFSIDNTYTIYIMKEGNDYLEYMTFIDVDYEEVENTIEPAIKKIYNNES